MENLLKQSMEYVQKNIHAKTDELPMELLDYWLVNDVEDDNQDQWTVFMTAYVKLKSQGKKKPQIQIDTVTLLNLFEDWQLLLSLVKSSRFFGDNVKSVAAFDFEAIKYYDFEWSLGKQDKAQNS